jgi:parallel beta-helix repeat protein
MRTFQIGIVVLLVTAGFVGMMNLSSDNVHGSLVGGTITSDTRWVPENNPYVIVSPINIMHGGSLRLEPGVNVIYDGNHRISVYGALVLKGTEAERVSLNTNLGQYEYMDWTGIYVGPYGYVDISYADLWFSGKGMVLKSSYNKIMNTTITNNKFEHSVELVTSSYNSISGNAFSGLGLGISGNTLQHYNSHDIALDNTVNGDPLLYYKDSESLWIDAVPAGQVILANCSGSAVRNLQILGSGITVAYSDGNAFYANSVKESKYGIHLYESDNNAISFSTVSWNYLIGLYLLSSDGNMILNNNITSSFMGVGLLASSANAITGNNIESNLYGIRLYTSKFSLIAVNNIIDNSLGQGYDDNGFNVWTKVYPDGGNYWSDYSPTCVDLYSGSVTPQTAGAPDGICDNPYYVDGDTIDYYPRVSPAPMPFGHESGSESQVSPDSQISSLQPIPLTTPPAERTGFELKEGWNTVSYPLSTEKTVSDALSGVPYERVELKEEGSEKTVLLDDNDLMMPGQIYLIKVSSATIWIFDD